MMVRNGVSQFCEMQSAVIRENLRWLCLSTVATAHTSSISSIRFHSKHLESLFVDHDKSAAVCRMFAKNMALSRLFLTPTNQTSLLHSSCIPILPTRIFQSHKKMTETYGYRRYPVSYIPCKMDTRSVNTLTFSKSRDKENDADAASSSSPLPLPSPSILTEECAQDTSLPINGAKKDKNDVSPKETVAYLDKYIVGQTEAKKAVANALRQRWRRQRLKDENLKFDITPKNIIMVGPTGVGKTEIARRISKLVDAPFLKVEATKFTEVGFHGRDADQIIKDLVELAVKKQHSKFENELRIDAEKNAEDRILDALFGKLTEEDRQSWLGHLREGILDDRVILVDVPFPPHPHGGGVASADPIETAIREAMSQHNSIKSVKVLQQSGGRAMERKSLSVKDAKEKLIQAELETLINHDMIYQKAIYSVEQEGIVFIDEIDKICTKNHGGYTGPDASAEGVQRDLLPLIEGCSVSTRYGNVKTDYILFIASGAFHAVKPSDMLAELQGRLPVKVELKQLNEEEFVRILTEPQNNLITQSIALLETEGISLEFTEEAIKEVAKVSCEINSTVENIGARRLHTVLERVLQDINFQAPNMEKGNQVVVDADFVRTNIFEFLKKTDLSKYIL